MARTRTPRLPGKHATRPPAGHTDPPAPEDGHVHWLHVRRAKQNNLKDIDVDIPLGRFVCVTGVSGSGKSSLVNDILREQLRRDLNGSPNAYPGAHQRIDGWNALDNVIDIDQSPIGRTPRSNPATYIKVFDEIRRLYARLPDANVRGYKPGRFSFNVPTGPKGGGRCEACEGNGANKMEMDFLADVWVQCPVCEGKRFSRETLQIYFKHKNISDVLNMDVQQALDHFRNIPKIRTMLRTLHDVGLDYVKLGQSSTTLSGGEAQRIKLARELVKRSTGQTLYLLDEPTTGLHFDDIKKLLAVLHGFVDAGNTVIVIEHNLDVIKTADWVIDLGPEGGEKGGYIVAQGTPEHVAAAAQSYTGAVLAAVLGIRRPTDAIDVPPVQSPLRPRANKRRQRRKQNNITVVGARQHNLKDITVTIPRDKMTVCSGVSGSGKSSLALDTIYAEGQRRYVESLSAYARQFLGQIQKPKVDHVYGLSPAISIEQKNPTKSPRSTVGTVTEIYDYLRVLYARIGRPHCPACDAPIKTQSSDEIVERILGLGDGLRALLLAPIARATGETYPQLFARTRASGFSRIRIDGTLHEIRENIALDHGRKHTLDLVVDRMIIRPRQRARITDSVEQALALGGGALIVAPLEPDNPPNNPVTNDLRFSQLFACDNCRRSYEELTPNHFSFNTRIGWCPSCEGIGTQRGADPSAIVVKPTRSLVGGAIAGWPAVPKRSRLYAMLQGLADHLRFDLETPWNQLSPAAGRAVLQGTGHDWITVPGWSVRFQWKGFFPAIDEATKAGWEYRRSLQHLTSTIPCIHCRGSRLRPEAAAVRLKRRTVHDVTTMALDQAYRFFKTLRLDSRERRIAGELLHEITARLKFLLDVGLDYLTLGRATATLSGGESQRIRLASQIGSGLTGVLYVLDEPTIGLHPRDNARLIAALHNLRDIGNTMLVVEHDRDVINSADHVLDFGPGSGAFGGRITAQADPKNLQNKKASLTGRYLSGKNAIPVFTNRRPINDDTHWLQVIGARANNLKDIDVAFPLGRCTVVTGVSGSGKSSLVDDVLQKELAKRIHRVRVTPGGHDKVLGLERVDKVINVDQSPIGNAPTSNPATYTGLFDLVRQLFARLPESKVRGYTANRFSFNRPGGRCEVCEGNGQRCIEMHFLPDVWVRCEACDGRRYQRETLEVKFKGKSIADILDMRVADACDLFARIPKIRRMLDTLSDVGLDYVQLGQPAPTLSGGEAQRVKLAAELGRPQTGKTVYILDEPTTGLHFDDLKKLLAVLNRLVDLGNTVICIEHNMDVIKTADWVIDLGPDAGDDGGRVVAAGPPEQLADHPHSHTGRILKKTLDAGPFEHRTVFDPTAQAAENIDDEKPIELADAVDAKMPWTKDGQRWHARDRRDRTGQQVQWAGDALDWVVRRIQKSGQFQPTNWNHRTRVEITGSRRDVSWFFHALTGDAWLLDLTFRVPRGAMNLKEKAAAIALKTLDERDDLPIYGRWRRAHVRRANPQFDQLRLQVHDRAEIDTPAFRSFLKQAARAYLEKVAETERDPDKAQPWKTNGKQWHLAQRAIRPGRKRLWKPPDLIALVGRINKAVPGLDWEWNRKVLIGFRSKTGNWRGRIVTNHPHALHIDVRTGKNLLTPTQVEHLGDDVQIIRDKTDFDRVRFWLPTGAPAEAKQLAEFLRKAAASLDNTKQEGP